MNRNNNRRENNFDFEQETFVRSDNDNTNRLFDRNTNTATVRNSGNSTVNVRINIEDED
jgi:hypothetical protein